MSESLNWEKRFAIKLFNLNREPVSKMDNEKLVSNFIMTNMGKQSASAECGKAIVKKQCLEKNLFFKICIFFFQKNSTFSQVSIRTGLLQF